jgi:hypothetical protein
LLLAELVPTPAVLLDRAGDEPPHRLTPGLLSTGGRLRHHLLQAELGEPGDCSSVDPARKRGQRLRRAQHLAPRVGEPGAMKRGERIDGEQARMHAHFDSRTRQSIDRSAVAASCERADVRAH